MNTPLPDTSAAATNVAEVISEMDAGMFERMLSIALSQTAAKVVDHDKKGKVTIELSMEHIKGTQQIRMAHTLKYQMPTGTGKSSEEASGATVLYVGRFGKLSLAQPSLLQQSNQSSIPGA